MFAPAPEAKPNKGAVAQLGERVLCKHEVVGSIPSGSTIDLVSSPSGVLCCLRLSQEIRPDLRVTDLAGPLGLCLLFVIVNRFF